MNFKSIIFILIFITLSIYSCKTIVKSVGLETCRNNCDPTNPAAMSLEKRQEAQATKDYDESSIAECIKKCEGKYK